MFTLYILYNVCFFVLWLQFKYVGCLWCRTVCFDTSNLKQLYITFPMTSFLKVQFDGGVAWNGGQWFCNVALLFIHNQHVG